MTVSQEKKCVKRLKEQNCKNYKVPTYLFGIKKCINCSVVRKVKINDKMK